jgi:hypothetical protein
MMPATRGLQHPLHKWRTQQRQQRQDRLPVLPADEEGQNRKEPGEDEGEDEKCESAGVRECGRRERLTLNAER